MTSDLASPPLPTSSKQPVIEFVGAQLTYPGPPPVTAFSDVNMSVRPGEYVSIIGPSGSGKSSLLNVAGLLERPTRGRFLVDGLDTATLNDRERSSLRGRRIGFVFQAFHLLPHRNAVENVQMATTYRGRRDQRADRNRAIHCLTQVGLEHRMWATPNTLSGGEAQRVAIARALMGKPGLLLLDEPTGNLDTARTAQLLDLFDTLHQQEGTLVMITHNPVVAQRAQRTYEMTDGRLTTKSTRV